MSLVLHHLMPAQKREALAEIRRDVSQAIDCFERTAEHRAGRLDLFAAG